MFFRLSSKNSTANQMIFWMNQVIKGGRRIRDGIVLEFSNDFNPSLINKHKGEVQTIFSKTLLALSKCEEKLFYYSHIGFFLTPCKTARYKGWPNKNLIDHNYDEYLSYLSTYNTKFGCFLTALLMRILEMSLILFLGKNYYEILIKQ